MRTRPSMRKGEKQAAIGSALIAVLSLLSFNLVAQENSAPLIFSVVGDVPYGNAALARFPELASSIEQSGASFVIHIGDIKGGSASCSDEMLSSRVSIINAIKKPVVYIPGDNDWTDCHRLLAGRFNPLERLGFLRQQAFPVVGQSLGQPSMTVESQASIPGFEEFPEHQRWIKNNHAFITLHLLGSANGFESFRGRTAEDDAEVVRRINASIAWLKTSMELAAANNAASIVVAIHGNPLTLSDSRASRYQLHPFAGILTELKQQTNRFGKPVLLIHGDTHEYKFDQPFTEDNAGAEIANLFRLEGIGDPAIGWVEVLADDNNPQVFSVTPHFIAQ